MEDTSIHRISPHVSGYPLNVFNICICYRLHDYKISHRLSVALTTEKIHKSVELEWMSEFI